MTSRVERHLVAPSMALCLIALAVSWIIARTVEGPGGSEMYFAASGEKLGSSYTSADGKDHFLDWM